MCIILFVTVMTWVRRVLAKCGGVAIVLVQYGCIAHCTLEFVGDFVLVSKIQLL